MKICKVTQRLSIVTLSNDKPNRLCKNRSIIPHVYLSSAKMAVLSSCRAGGQFSYGDTDLCQRGTFYRSQQQGRQIAAPDKRLRLACQNCAGGDGVVAHWSRGKMSAHNRAPDSERACFEKTSIVLESSRAATKEHAHKCHQ